MANETIKPTGRMATPIDAACGPIFAGERERIVPYHHMHGSPYCLPAFVPYTPDEVETLRQASETVDRIYRNVLRFVQRSLPDAFLVHRLGIPPAVAAAARLEVPYHVLSRQDWLLGPEGPVWIENNTDTPTGVPETAYLTGSLISDYGAGYSNPSEGMDKCLQQALIDLVNHYRSMGMDGKLIFSSLDWQEHAEDAANTAYVMEQARLAGLEAEFAPFGELEVIADDGLYWRGERVGIWYRLYPLEFLADDRDDEGYPIGEEVLRLAASGKLGLINPAQSAITQSKGFMALLWSLAMESGSPDGIYPLAPDEAAFIRRYMPDTYWTPDPFIQSGTAYAAKSMWGREGKGTALFGPDGKPLHADSEERVPDSNKMSKDTTDEEEDSKHYYESQPKIYQRYVPMEHVLVPLPDGDMEGWLLTGVYAVGGRYGGLLPRIGGRITGDLACFVPAATIEQPAIGRVNGDDVRV
ncbi:glutathionylspermidine synthase family protein [Paenibacillus kobensis]|uniref:glutathionylspermidine synthase family protein n=1 Tax=Paenibacillus kobensis TaxID=59841 RepID=UPI000FD8A0B2|nr:glutathionylspermidine synthase family protein [Paenibacillus kobensis]